MVAVFDGDDRAYLGWLETHGDGFVLNTRRGVSPDYMALHRAGCAKIRQYRELLAEGGFTERGYIKVCGTDLKELRAWVREHGRGDGSFTVECATCMK